MTAPVALSQNKSPKTETTKYTIGKNDLQLSDAINIYRSKRGLGELQLSPSLCFVAKTHLNDIRLYSKDEHGCNLNSWSDKGKWIPCCFNGQQKNLDLMTSKPSEIIGFHGKGFEIVVAAKKEISTNDLAKKWLEAKTTQDFILNKGQWSNRNWQCIGISIYNGFASIWASEMPDRMTDVAFEKEVSKITKSEPEVHSTNKNLAAAETVQSATKTNVPAKKPFLTRGAQVSYNTTGTKVVVPDPTVQNKSAKKTETIIEAEIPKDTDKGTSFFLVHSSYTSLEDAMKTIESLKKEGFKNLVMIDARGKYRVALGIYTSETAAKAALRKNSPRFEQLKIYNF
jgi:hypothetical protein